MPSTEKYHPIRYSRSRPFARAVVSAYESATGSRPEAPTSGAFQAITEVVMRGYNTALETMPRLERPANTRIAMKEVSYAFVHAYFSANGRNIFDFEPALVELFRHTDVAEVPLGAIQLPFGTQYLSFGPQEHLRLFDGQYLVDGAYVTLTFDHLQVYLSTRHATASDEQAKDFIRVPDKYYFLPFPFDQAERAVGDALDKALEEEAAAQKPSADWRDAFARTAQEAEQIGIKVTSTREATAAYFEREVREGAETFKAAMNLVVNALCYLTAYRDQVRTDWPSDAPASLRTKAEQGSTHKERRRAESKLLPLGFTRIRFCQLPETGQASMGATSETDRRAHWRRGHWRQQAVGPQRAERRLTWIRPVFVGGTGRVEGHIYDVATRPQE